MYSTRGFGEETLEALKECHARYYAGSFVNLENIGYIVYQHDTGIEVQFSEAQVMDFIDDVNEMIRSESRRDFLYAKQTLSRRDFENIYREYEKE